MLHNYLKHCVEPILSVNGIHYFLADNYLNLNCLLSSMTTESVSISAERYDILVKKEAIADDLVLQMESSLRDLEAGRVRRVR